MCCQYCQSNVFVCRIFESVETRELLKSRESLSFCKDYKKRKTIGMVIATSNDDNDYGNNNRSDDDNKNDKNNGNDDGNVDGIGCSHDDNNHLSGDWGPGLADCSLAGLAECSLVGSSSRREGRSPVGLSGRNVFIIMNDDDDDDGAQVGRKEGHRWG